MLWSMLALAAPSPESMDPELGPETDRIAPLPRAEGVQTVMVEPPTGTAVFVGERELVGLDFRPDRLATAQGHLAFVSGRTGWSSVWIVPLDGSTPPRQLTNVDLPKDRTGFVAPPAHPPVFKGAFLLWRDGWGQVHRVRWR